MGALKAQNTILLQNTMGNATVLPGAQQTISFDVVYPQELKGMPKEVPLSRLFGSYLGDEMNGNPDAFKAVTLGTFKAAPKRVDVDVSKPDVFGMLVLDDCANGCAVQGVEL